ncbi:hypothetical protein F1880_009934 [Penicillium rolfsii]|nr:hypothetical protein F1880_009934 [Penicillium rolfsii]
MSRSQNSGSARRAPSQFRGRHAGQNCLIGYPRDEVHRPSNPRNCETLESHLSRQFRAVYATAPPKIGEPSFSTYIRVEEDFMGGGQRISSSATFVR